MAKDGQATVAFKGAAVLEASNAITIRYISPIGTLKEFQVPLNGPVWGLLRKLPVDTRVTYQSDSSGLGVLVAIGDEPVDPRLKLQRRVAEVRNLRFAGTDVYFEYRYSKGEPPLAVTLPGAGFAAFQAWAEGRDIRSLNVLVDGRKPNAPVVGVEAGEVAYYAA